MMTGRCIHCREPLDSPDFRTCGRCCQLLRELDWEDEGPVFEPRPKPKRDGKWLAWAAAKRGQMHWFHRYGQQRGFPRDIRQWSAAMVEIAVQAKQANA